MARPALKKFYDSKLWRDTRLQVLHRDSYSCQLCGARGTEVHHLTPLTPDNVDDYSISLNPDNLQTLCWQCHNKTTRGVTDVPDGYCFDLETGQIIPDQGGKGML